MISHKDCSHPSTSKARAECRKRRTNDEVIGEQQAAPDIVAYHTEMQKLKVQRTKGKAATRKANEKAAKEKSHVIIEQAIKKLDKRPTCYMCDKHAGWIDTRNAEPVCMVHVDWDHVKLIPQ